MKEYHSTRFSFRAVEVFVTIVEEGAVNAAAKRLGASPSAISLQLSNLEEILGSRLLVRSSRQLSLTTAGEIFLPRAMKILDEISSAKAVLSKTGSHSRLLIKMSVIEDFDAIVLPRWLMALRQDFPNMRFNVHSGPSHENHAALGNRAADMIIAIETFEKAEWVEAHELISDPYIMVCSPKLADISSPEELMSFPFIRYSREQFMARQIEGHLKRNKFTPPRDHEFSSNQAVFSTVEALKGWTITTVSAFASISGHAILEDARLVAKELPLPAFNRNILLYARRGALGDLPLLFTEKLRPILDRQLETIRTGVLAGHRPSPTANR